MSTPAKTGPLEPGDAPPSLDGITWLKGKTPEFTRRFTVLELWATWCPPCLTSIPHLSSLQRAHPDALEIVGLTEEALTEVGPFVDRMGDAMAYTVGIAPESLYARILEGVDGIPHAFLFDDARRLLWSGHPMTMDDTLTGLLSGALTADALISLADFRKRIGDLEAHPDHENRTEWAARQHQRIDLYESIFELSPDDANALEAAVSIAQSIQDSARVHALLQRVQVDRFPAPAACSLAMTLVDPQRGVPKFYRLALALVEHALTLDKRAAVVDAYASICAFFGDFTSALEALDAYLDRDPDSIVIYASLRRLQERASLQSHLQERRNDAESTS